MAGVRPPHRVERYEVRAYLSAMAIGAPLLIIHVSRSWNPRLRYAVVNVVAVFFAPLAWNMYLPLLLAPAADWWGTRHSAAREARPG